jgi:centriolar protein POC1
MEYDPVVEKHYKGHNGTITGISFHPETKRIVSSSIDKTLMVWQITDTTRAYRFHGHKDEVTDVSYAPSGEVFASASKDRTVRIWVPKVRGESLDFIPHQGTVRSVQFNPDGNKVESYFVNFSLKLE